MIDPLTERVVAESAIGNLGQDPIEILEFYNPAGSGKTQFDVMISKAAGADPTLVKYILFNRFDGRLREHHTQSGTIFGHANSELVITVGAGNYLETPAFGYDEPLLESFSSAGGDVPWLFTQQGNRVVSAITPRKPDLTAPDNVNTQLPLGEDTDGDGNPNFRGTSAAAPHVAGVAALMLQANAALQPETIKSILQHSAIDVLQRNDSARTAVGANFDLDSGYGLVDAHAAVSLALNHGSQPVPQNNAAPIENILVHQSSSGAGSVDWWLVFLFIVLYLFYSPNTRTEETHRVRWRVVVELM